MIDRQFLRNIRPDIEAALKNVGEKYNVSFSLGSASFNSNNATFKLNVVTIGNDGEVHSKEADNFKRFAEGYGLSPDDLGKEISMGGKRFIITGLNTRAHKNPINIKQVDTGKNFKAPASSVKFALAILQS